MVEYQLSRDGHTVVVLEIVPGQAATIPRVGIYAHHSALYVLDADSCLQAYDIQTLLRYPNAGRTLASCLDFELQWIADITSISEVELRELREQERTFRQNGSGFS